jgi:hypothetical protein
VEALIIIPCRRLVGLPCWGVPPSSSVQRTRAPIELDLILLTEIIPYLPPWHLAPPYAQALFFFANSINCHIDCNTVQ